ncbi:glycine cleavage system T protein [Ceratobasidium sp. AG-Ba]|nr:glycine cleavage system T protein [Ceratobasidium sp. AG-Ba]
MNLPRLSLGRCAKIKLPSQAASYSTASASERICAKLPNRGVLSVSGTDSKTFLNGIVAASIRDHPFYTVFLSAQGRVLYDVFIYPCTTDGRPGFLIDFDSRSSEATPLITMLKRHILRSKVRVRDVSEEWNVWAVWGVRSGAIFRIENGGPEYTRDTIGARDLRAPNMGERLLVRSGDKPAISIGCDLARDGSQYILHRIKNAVPEGQEDIVPQHAFPMDSNMDMMGGLDFRKGCYVGQELTVRTYHTGVIRKRIMPVSLSQEGLGHSSDTPSLPLHTSIQAERLPSSSSDTSNRPTRPRGTGTLLSNVNGLGLALLRLEHVDGVEQGELEMNLVLPTDQHSAKWMVRPKRPTWWPTPLDDSEHAK